MTIRSPPVQYILFLKQSNEREMGIDEKWFEYALENDFLKSHQIDSIRVLFSLFFGLLSLKNIVLRQLSLISLFSLRLC